MINTPGFLCGCDTIYFNQLSNEIHEMDLRYTDYKFKDNSYIWTGKGDRKNGHKKGRRFIEASKKFQ